MTASVSGMTYDISALLLSVPSSVELGRLLPNTEGNNDRWRKAREGKMSASRVGAALGHDEHTTPQEAAFELVHGVPLRPPNEIQQAVMDRGNREEPCIRETFRRLMRRRGYHVVDGVGVFTRGGMEGAYIATPDGFVVQGGQVYVAEYKRVSRYPVIPNSCHLLQVWMQCHVTGASGGYLFCVTPDEGWVLWSLDATRIPLHTTREWLSQLQHFTECKERIAGEKVRQTGRSARKIALVDTLRAHGALSAPAWWRGHVYDGADGAVFFGN